MSAYLGINETVINRAIRNPRITIQTLTKIAKFLECPVDVLLNGVPNNDDIQQTIKNTQDESNAENDNGQCDVINADKLDVNKLLDLLIAKDEQIRKSQEHTSADKEIIRKSQEHTTKSQEHTSEDKEIIRKSQEQIDKLISVIEKMSDLKMHKIQYDNGLLDRSVVCISQKEHCEQASAQ